MRAATRPKCLASKDRNGVVLVCGRDRGHSVLECFDADEGTHFTAPDRVGFPRLQPLGVRKLRPIASELLEALDDLRNFMDPDNPNCSIPADVRKASAHYLSTWVEGPLAHALGQIDPRYRTDEER